MEMRAVLDGSWAKFYWIFLLFWVALSFYIAWKKEWFLILKKSESFPFTARKFFLMFFILIAGFGSYIASFFIGHMCVAVFKTLPFGEAWGTLSQHEWFAVEQLFGLTIACGLLSLLLSFVPSDLISCVDGGGRSKKKWLKGAFYALLLYPVVIGLSYLASVLYSLWNPEAKAPQIALDLLSNLNKQTLLFWLLSFYTVFVVSYVEETLFRGILQGFLGGILHPFFSVVVTAIIFALFHYSSVQKGSNFEIITGLFVFSLLASGAKERENSISAAMGMHAVFNALSLFFVFLI